MAFPVILNGRTYTLADFEGTNYVDGFPDALEDFVTQAGDIYNSTSTSSVAIGTGSKSFTTADSDKPYQAGTPLRIADAAAPETNFMDCIVTSYSGTSLVVESIGFGGSGTKSSWTINIGGAKTVDGTLAIIQGGTGATTAAAAASALGLGTEDSPEFTGLTVTSSGDFSGATISDLGTVTTADINGGTIDNTVIGGSTPAAGSFTTVTGSGDMNIDSGTLFVDASENRVGIGTSSPQKQMHIESATGGTIRLSSSDTSIGAGESLGEIDWYSNDTSGGGSGVRAFINVVENDGGLGRAYDMTFGTGAVATASERTRITSSGNLLVGKTSSSSAFAGAMLYDSGNVFGTVDGNYCARFNRLTNDGNIVELQQASVTEGTISVSGSTVSYNGGHLARWSQTIDDSRIDGLVKGTVLSNLDEMCEWKRVEFEYQALVSEAVEAQDAVYETQTDEDGNETEVLVSEAVESQDAVYETRTTSESYEGDANVGDVVDWEYEGLTVQATVILEDNEQLNRMKISDVEGDPNVAGVFVNWDDDDDVNTADMNIAMTGDMVIRIAQGTTVARGDLLMSAGDGTAKPQGDDIVRSKTIAKVTSTHVSHTYDNGSYLVPCVLMAC